jgi:hypothetical protein
MPSAAGPSWWRAERGEDPESLFMERAGPKEVDHGLTKMETDDWDASMFGQNHGKLVTFMNIFGCVTRHFLVDSQRSWHMPG